MNNYYVYIHKDTAGRLIYVGSGVNYRYTSKQHRSQSWYEATLDGFIAEKLCEGLDKNSARELEDLLIQMIGIENLTNKNYPAQALEITHEILSLFKYDENSPSGLVWKSGRKQGCCAGVREARNGENHRWRVHIPGTNTSVANHRIIWSLHFNLPPDSVIDHIDGNPWNNRIENLRAVDMKINSRNMKKRSTNTSGVTGVHFKQNRTGHTYWTAIWREDTSKNKSKSFMIEKYGYDEAFNLACEFRKNKIEELKARGFGYTDRHLA